MLILPDTHTIYMNRSHTFPILLLGYGNFDREDDGVAWHILARVAARLGLSLPTAPEDFEFNPGNQIDFYFSLQLVPEMAETISSYARVCFIDAHTGAVPEEIHSEVLVPRQQASPFTHHMTPATLLTLAATLYNQEPQSMLISVRGYDFGFSQLLTPRTDALATQAVEQILGWIDKS